MKKILIELKNNILKISYKNKVVKENLLNTNVISNNELLFSKDYLIENYRIVSSFIKDLVVEHEIKTIEIENVELAELVTKLLSKIPSIELYQINSNENISFTLSELIIDNKNIEKVSCYSTPPYVIEYMDRAGILLESRSEILFTSNFMQTNNLSSFSKIYYKVSLRINDHLDNNDLTDIETFCKINKYLKTIHIENYTLDTVKKVIDILNVNKRKNIKILIHDNITNEKDIIELKQLNKVSKKYNNIIRLVYSKDYISDNYLKQMIFTTLKYAACITLIIVFMSFGYITYNNIVSLKKVDSIKYKINEVIENNKADIKEEELTTHGPSVIKELLNINSDTIGWLTVKGTNIDYPVVQGIDNSYYLNKNYKKEKDFSGWVFMDYRNNLEDLDQNSIIYAHNRYDSKVMFGTLNNLLKKKWHEDKDNYIITFNTLYHEMQFEIFSIYKIKNTNDYITTNFKNDNAYLDFIDLIKNRSEFKFDTNISKDDKILTLSTCFENNKRLVVHAKLINK